MFNQRIEPKPGQESVWDYPRPPRLEDSSKQIQVVFNGVTIAETHRAKRVLETSHPPVYYIPPEDVRMEYFTMGDKQASHAAWFYANPTPAFAGLQNYIAVYPSQMEACYVDGERVQAQPGDFYGGWITSDIVGPFKGGVGTWGW